MTQEDKKLLFKDLCSRLPYGVKVKITSRESKNRIVHLTEDNISHLTGGWWSECKPYLFPLSSMTEEQKQYLKNRFCYDWDGEPDELWKYQIEIGEADELIDWFHENHIDYRCFIPKGLALDASNLNIY